MAVDLELTPKQKAPAGQPCCEPVVYPDVERAEAEMWPKLGQSARRAFRNNGPRAAVDRQ